MVFQLNLIVVKLVQKLFFNHIKTCAEVVFRSYHTAHSIDFYFFFILLFFRGKKVTKFYRLKKG